MKSLKFAEPYKCQRDCKTATGWDHEKRSARGCTLPGLAPVEWHVTADALRAPRSGAVSTDTYMGRTPDPSLAGTFDLAEVNPALPAEATDEGCPGGWYRTPFASSVLRYQRVRVEGGARVPNPFFDAAGEHVWAAVLEFELEQRRFHAHASEQGRRIAERQRKTAPKNGHRR